MTQGKGNLRYAPQANCKLTQTVGVLTATEEKVTYWKTWSRVFQDHHNCRRMEKMEKDCESAVM